MKIVDEKGTPVSAESLERTIWYGQCGYWTDDWDKTVRIGSGIPACPKCKTPGFICVAREWFIGAEAFDKKEPGYLAFLRTHKEKCYRHYPKGFMDVWEMTKDMTKGEE